jgi:hypothetical protein
MDVHIEIIRAKATVWIALGDNASEQKSKNIIHGKEGHDLVKKPLNVLRSINHVKWRTLLPT